MGQSKEGSHRRRASVGSRKLLPDEFHLDGFCLLQNTSRLEIDQGLPQGQTLSGHMAGVKKRLKDVRNGLDTSMELLKVLNRIWSLGEQNSTSLSLFAALKDELNRSLIQVNELIQQQRSSCYEIDQLLKQFAEEKAAWKVKQRHRIQSAVMSIVGELEVEKKLRRQSERLNKKLGRELSDTKASLSRTMKELDSEKRAREILEQVCDELARDIGEDNGEAEELKRQSAKVRKEVEKEWEMLHLDDVLPEEKGQMKLSEAKCGFEEKNVNVEKLRSEVEAYLKTEVGEEQSYGSPNFERIKELKRYLRETLPNTCQEEDKEKANGLVINRDEQGEEDDSADSDLCSIELNMDENCKNRERDHTNQNGSKRKSVDEKHRRRRSTSEKIQRQSISTERVATSEKIQRQSIPTERVASDCLLEREFSPIRRENSDVLNRSRLFELSSEVLERDYDDEIERYKMIKDLRDHIVSSSRMASTQGFASPTKQW